MNKKNAVSAILVTSFLFFLFCGKGREENPDVNVIHNDKTPGEPSVSLVFHPDESFGTICDEAWAYPTKLLPDDEGNIYVFDDGAEKPTFYRFDESGRLTLTKSFNRGQGPGELGMMNPYFDSSGCLHIFDRYSHRLIVLDEDFEYKDMVKFETNLFHVQADSNNFIYGFAMGTPNEEQRKPPIVFPEYLGRFSADGNLLSKIFDYTTFSIRISGSKGIIYAYPRYGIHRISGENEIYYAQSDLYEINIKDSHGILLKKIIKEADKILITDSDIRRNIQFGGPIPTGREFETAAASEHKPYIDDFLILDNGYLLVMTYEYDDGEHDTVRADLFDETGRFLTKVDVPGYYGAYSPFLWMKKAKAVQGDYFYTIRENETGEVYCLRRYRMELRGIELSSSAASSARE